MNGKLLTAEAVADFWLDAALEHGFALVALQFWDAPTEQTDGGEDVGTDDEIFDALSQLFALCDPCLHDDAKKALYGLSMGANFLPRFALLDADHGFPLAFDLFILDSGGNPLAVDPDPMAMVGTNFWMYCGGLDGDMCVSMSQTQQTLLARGATIEDFVQDPDGGHGLFGNPSSDDAEHALITLLRGL